MARCCSSQIWVMPTFSPTMALVATRCASLEHSPGRHALTAAPYVHANAPPGFLRAERLARFGPEDAAGWRRAFGHIYLGPATSVAASSTEQRPTEENTPSLLPGARGPWGANPAPGNRLGVLNLDLDIDAGRQVEALERVDRLRGVLHDVDQALVHPHLEVLPAVLVLVRGADHRVAVLVRRQRDRALHLGLGAQHRLDDLLRRLVQDLMVVRLQADPDLLLGAVSHARGSRFRPGSAT